MDWFRLIQRAEHAARSRVPDFDPRILTSHEQSAARLKAQTQDRCPVFFAEVNSSPAKPPKVVPLEASQIRFPGLWPLSFQQVYRAEHLLFGEEPPGKVHLRCVLVAE